MKISVALCTFNGAKYLKQQLETIKRQSLPPDELVIFDDCSNDETIEIINDFAKCSFFPVVLRQNESNIGSTLNFSKCIASCSGDIILTCDQDDVWSPNKIDRLVSRFVENPEVDLVFSNAYVVDKSLNGLNYLLWESSGLTKAYLADIKSGKALQILLKRNFVTGATMAFKAKFKKIIIPIPQSWVHDGWIALLIAATGLIGIIEEPLICYRQHDNQQIGARKKHILELYEYARKTNAASYSEQKRRYELALERLRENHLLSDEVAQLLSKKISFMQSRVEMYTSDLRGRIRLAANSLLNREYCFYSNGWRSFVKDIFLPGI